MNLIGYLRCSTRKQGESGLGLEAQQAAIEGYAKQQGGRILALYTEVESGKVKERPILAKALAHARRAKAAVCVHKLDRLARNVAFTSALIESQAKLVVVDNPSANHLTLHILSAVSEAEAKAISDRTKQALAAYKARGGKLGASLPQCRNLTDEDRRKGVTNSVASRRQAMVEAYRDILDDIRARRESGLTLQEIADLLNAEGHTTRQGSQWSPAQIHRVLRMPA